MAISDSHAGTFAPGTGIYIKETIIVLAATLLLPVLIHLIPPVADVTWGARLLPMFYAPLVGLILFRLHVGLIPALVAPALNLMLTGSPGSVLAALLTIELTAFTLIAFALLRRFPNFWLAAPLAYILTKGISAVVVMLVPSFAMFQPVGSFVWTSISTALPGLLVLIVVQVIAQKVKNRTDG